MTKIQLHGREGIRRAIKADHKRLDNYKDVGSLWGLSGGTVHRLVNDSVYWPKKQTTKLAVQKHGKKIGIIVGIRPLPNVFIERFWTKVDKSGDCWEYKGGKKVDGYGVYHLNKKTVRAHRYSWEISNGPIPEGLLVCHRCDNPGCVNPDHLFLGTQIDNMQDSIKKGRFVKREGENNPRSILTEKKVLTIRADYEAMEKKNMAELGRKYDIPAGQIESIVKRIIWKHI
jgi:hypothetical protein